MATQKIITANVQRPKQSATVLQPGTVSGNSIVTRSLGIETVGFHSGSNGSLIPSALSDATIAANSAGDTEPAAGRSKNGLYKPYTAGLYAGGMVAGRFIALGLSTYIGGVANTTLYTGAADFGNRRSMNQINSIRTSFLRIWTWTGAKDGPPTYTKTYSNRTPTQNFYGNDQSIGTRAIPAEMVYLYGLNTPTMVDIPAKTGG